MKLRSPLTLATAPAAGLLLGAAAAETDERGRA